MTELTYRPTAAPRILRDPRTGSDLLVLGWWCTDGRRVFVDTWMRVGARDRDQLPEAWADPPADPVTALMEFRP